MLKIKDNVDLKELEKYGFKEWSYHYDFILDEDYEESFIINKSGRTIEITSCMAGTLTKLDKLYDLIKDGLVEKVEE